MDRTTTHRRIFARITIATTLLGTALIGGCSSPDFEGPHWREGEGYELYEEGDVYIVVATTIKPGDRRAFVRQAEELAEELRTQEGVVLFGYGGSLTKGTAQTLSVWRDAESLGAFMGSPGHLSAVANHSAGSEAFATDMWEIDGRDLPPSWEEAEIRLAAVLGE